ncbi:MAG: hypothetical protein QM756_30430 [Polyangiaceae bacterium]
MDSMWIRVAPISAVLRAVEALRARFIELGIQPEEATNSGNGNANGNGSTAPSASATPSASPSASSSSGATAAPTGSGRPKPAAPAGSSEPNPEADFNPRPLDGLQPEEDDEERKRAHEVRDLAASLWIGLGLGGLRATNSAAQILGPRHRPFAADSTFRRLGWRPGCHSRRAAWRRRRA